jgi:hypothetical protein
MTPRDPAAVPPSLAADLEALAKAVFDPPHRPAQPPLMPPEVARQLEAFAREEEARVRRAELDAAHEQTARGARAVADLAVELRAVPTTLRLADGRAVPGWAMPGAGGREEDLYELGEHLQLASQGLEAEQGAHALLSIAMTFKPNRRARRARAAKARKRARR